MAMVIAGGIAKSIAVRNLLRKSQRNENLSCETNDFNGFNFLFAVSLMSFCGGLLSVVSANLAYHSSGEVIRRGAGFSVLWTVSVIMLRITPGLKCVSISDSLSILPARRRKYSADSAGVP